METERTQVLVVGSGAGGAVTAAALAEAGFSVLIAEEGPPVDLQGRPTHSPEALRDLFRCGGLTPILGKPSIAFVEGRCVGGSTEVNSALWHRTPPSALKSSTAAARSLAHTTPTAKPPPTPLASVITSGSTPQC